ncbi:MAG: hypothetical protein ABIC36_01245 [bacterium]
MKKSILTIAPFFALLAFLPFQCQEVIDDGGLFKSDNMGENWRQLTVKDKQLSITSLDILSMAVDPNNSNNLYLGTSGNGLYRSYSQGEYWSKVEDKNNVLLNRANIHDIVIDPKDSNRIYIGAYQDKRGRVFRSYDSGESWEEVYVTSDEKYAVFAMAVDNYDPSVVYMGTAQGGFLKSADYGKSWEIIEWFEDVISDIVINPNDSRIIYISTFNNGVYKTVNKGETWQSFGEILKDFQQAKKVERLVIDSQRPNILYTCSEYGLLTSKDGGQTWQEVKIIMPPKPVLGLAIESENTDHLYYGAGAILYRSLDQGKNWTVHELTSGRSIKTILIDPKDSQIVYVGMRK